ncbi:metallophosphoesterase [Paenibacillus curdlanolyticus YK9]|uniref:Metallophosphoesterase n=1 Tax=Paenibacillus curdlanolyticus YK9 TaxID=717606 RepID=E0IAL3_9BACL|nr:metallophosphoesterase [Paenibacillus curdlanolyticus]EFM10417.1 metallophosphoesterase [Paenibacillus curdlanolyticus YK9]
MEHWLVNHLEETGVSDVIKETRRLASRAATAVAAMLLAQSIGTGLIGAKAEGTAAVGSSAAVVEPTDRYTTVKRSDGLNLVFPVISDIHIGAGDKAVTKFTSVMKQINRIAPHYDAMVSAGDLTDKGEAAQYDSFMAVYNSQKQASARHLLAIGNHDYYGSSSASRAQKLFMDKTGMPGIYYDAWINGYHFIVIGSESKTTNGTLSDRQLGWLNAKLADHASADKPIFVIFHQHISNTVYGSDEWGHTQKHKQLYAILARYPQVITFSGHSHYMLNDPRSAHQRDFTSFGTASVRYPELESGMAQGSHPSDDIAQGYIVQVKDKQVIVKRRDFHRDDWTGEDWIVDYPARKSAFRYTDDRDKEKPQFGPAAKAVIMPGSIRGTQATVSFNQASDNLFVHSYDIEVSRASTGKHALTVHAFSEFYKYPMPSSLSFELKGLTPDTAYVAKVVAIDSFGNRSAKPLAVSFRTAKLSPLRAGEVTRLLSLSMYNAMDGASRWLRLYSDQ